MNRHISWAAWCLGLAQIPFILNFFLSMKNGKKVASDNPWESTTLEWQTPTPPPDRKSTRLNSSHLVISYAVFCLKKKNNIRPLRVYPLNRDGHLPEAHMLEVAR